MAPPPAPPMPESSVDALLTRIAELEAKVVALGKGKAEEHSHADAAQERNQALLRMVAEMANIITWEWNPDEADVQWGSDPDWLLGPRPEDGAYPPFSAMAHPADLEELLGHARAAQTSGEGFASQLRLRRTDGNERWILMRCHTLAEGKRPSRWLFGIAADNHDRRAAEIQTEHLSRQHRALLDNLPNFAWTKDLHGRYTAVNKAYAANVGMEPGELIGKLDAEILSAPRLAQIRQDEKQVIESRQTLRWERPYMFGKSSGWVETVKSPVLDRAGNVIGVVGTSHDITERKKVEMELAASEKRFRDFAELSADWYWKQDPELRLVEMTESGQSPSPWKVALGKKRWETPGVDLNTPGWGEHMADLAARRPFRDFVFVVNDPVRGRVWARVSGLPIFDTQGNFAGYHGVGRDITAQMQSADALRLAQERVELALQGSQMCFWDYDIVSGSVYLSEGWEQFCGSGNGATLTTIQHLSSTVHPDDITEVKRILRETLQGKREEYEVEHRSRTTNGEYRWLYSRGKVTARDATGRALRMSGTNLDIHERHILQESLRAALREQEKLMETCPTGLAILRNRVFERCNPAVGKMLGYTAEELIGQSTRMMFPDEQSWRDVGKLLYPSDGSPGAFSTELEFRRRDGKVVWVLLSGYVMDPRQNYGIFSLVDVTAQRNVAAALLQAKEASDSANKAKSDFLATVSHEIRTPMNGVLGLLELLEFSKLDDSQRETVHSVRELASSLLGLIDDVLDFSKIEAGQLPMRPEPVNLPSLAKQSVSLYQELAGKKSLEIDLTIDAQLSSAHVCDGMRLRQILNNLLSNAVKFTLEGGIKVSINGGKINDGVERVEFCIVDSGIGISDEDQRRLFQPFVQADAGTTRKFGGTGLGLSICKRLAQALGGDIAMASVLGRGTTVTLELPLPVARPEDVVALATPEPLVNTERENEFLPTPALPPVLIAEDHAVNLKLLARQLQYLGLKTETATDGMEALTKWSQGHYLAIITDCHMPVMDGYALAREIRTIEGRRGIERGIPIIACTASALAGDAQACIEAGMNDHIAKPVSIGALRQILTPWITGKRAPLQRIEKKDADIPSPMDLRALLDFSGGDPEAEMEILKEYREANRLDATALIDALNANDMPSARHFAHRMKGASRSIGAGPLAELCESLELACRKENNVELAPIRAEFLAQDARLIDFIECRLADLRVPRTESVIREQR